jgi:YidC/Oxa1 family membrane protein insertase
MDFLVNALLALNNLLGGQLWLTLVLLGVGVRVVFAPMMRKQQEQAKKMQGLQPKLKELKKIHGEDKVKMAQAQADLFKDHGVNPVGGCLPMLVQMGVFIVLYQAILRLFDKGLNTQWLWWDLAKPDVIPVEGLPFALPGLWILLAAGSQLIMSKMMMPRPVPVEKEDKPKEVEEKTDLMEDIQKMQGQMIYMFPLMFVFIGYQFPAGLAMYWSATTVASVYFQYRHQGWGSLRDWLKWLPEDEEPEVILNSKDLEVKGGEELKNFAAAMGKESIKTVKGKKKQKKKKKK